MPHINVFGIRSVHDSKVLDINVARWFSRDRVFYYIDIGHSLFIKWSEAILWLSKFEKDSTEIFCMLYSSDCGKELSFFIGCRSSGLGYGAIRDIAIVQKESIASCRMATGKVIFFS